MNILVVSDSHGRTSKIIEAFEAQIKKPDAVIFLGDGLRDLSYCNFGDIPIYAVSGNCDFFGFIENNYPDEIVTCIGGKRFLITHGHKYNVKSGLGALISSAVKLDVDIVLFGHTHTPVEIYLPEGECQFGVMLKKPIRLMNPGSIGGYEASFGTIEIDRASNVLTSLGNLKG